MGEDRFTNYCFDTSTLPDATNMTISTTNTQPAHSICITTATPSTNTQILHPHEFTLGTLDCDKIKAMLLGDFPTPNKLLANVDIPAIKDYAIYNNRVIKVDFVDGTSTKCICDDEFDFYTGLAYCLFKRVLGKDGHKKFNDMMRAAIKAVDKIDEQKDKEKAEEARCKAKRRKAELKRAAKKAKERQDKIDIQVEAMRLYARENRGKDDA